MLNNNGGGVVSKWLLYLFFLLVLCSLVWGVGVCELDQFDYYPGELATFSCSCSSPSEESKEGFIVWRNESVVLLNESVDSGDCTVSFFSSQFVFPVGANYSGNVTFETGSAAWSDGVVSDDFNVSGASIFDCTISSITSGSSMTLGELGSVKFYVLDSISGHALVNVACMAEGYDVGGEPILFEPYGSGFTARYTLSDGEIGFQHLMVERSWMPFSTYLFEFHCVCFNESCVDEVTGLSVGFKSCTTQLPFVTGVDNRGSVDGFLPIVLVLIAFICYFGLVGLCGVYFYGVRDLEVDRLPFWVVFVSFGMVLVEFVLLAFLVYANEVGAGLFGLLLINFYVMLLVGGGAGLIVLYLVILYIFSLKRLRGGEVDDKKFSKDW